MTLSLPDPDVAFERAKREILADIEKGAVPATVTTFSELHDHVDANWYGGLFDLEIDANDEADTAFANNLQDRLDAWLRNGRSDTIHKCEVQIPGTMMAYYENGAITELVFTPHGGDAGYFGPSAVLFDGDVGLDLEDTDGPFWRAIERFLGEKIESIVAWRE